MKEEIMPKSSNLKVNTKVYLQGLKALKACKFEPSEEVSFVVGSDQSNIIVQDNRKNTLDAVEQILSGDKTVDFAEAFNLPAQVEIDDSEEVVQIKMSECPSKGYSQTLWLGVIRNQRMPVHEVAWEILRPLEKNATAFAAIVNE
jgi:hypothetical protein